MTPEFTRAAGTKVSLSPTVYRRRRTGGRKPNLVSQHRRRLRRERRGCCWTKSTIVSHRSSSTVSPPSRQKRSVPSVYNQSFYTMRDYVFRQSFTLALLNFYGIYEILFRISNPSDPMARHTLPDPEFRQKPNAFEHYVPGRPRWEGILPLFFVLASDAVISSTVLRR